MSPAISPLFDLALHDKFQQNLLKQQKSGGDFLLNYTALEALDRLSFVKRNFQHGVDYFGYTGLWGAKLQQSGKVKKITQIHNQIGFAHKELNFVFTERETLPESLVQDGVDLYLCPLMLHFVNDLPLLLRKICQSLQPDGLFLGCMPGVGTLQELRASMFYAEESLYQKTHMRISSFTDVRSAGDLLQYAGFAMPVVDRQDLSLHYDNVAKLYQDLRQMGMQNILLSRSKRPLSRRFFALVEEYYRSHFAEQDGRLSATISLLWLSGWAADRSRPKAPRVGSGKLSPKIFPSQG